MTSSVIGAQDPTPGVEFEHDGSNTASVFEGLGSATRRELIDELAAIVPDISNVEIRFSTKMSLCCSGVGCIANSKGLTS
jgi:hypothetical protein